MRSGLRVSGTETLTYRPLSAGSPFPPAEALPKSWHGAGTAGVAVNFAKFVGYYQDLREALGMSEI